MRFKGEIIEKEMIQSFGRDFLHKIKYLGNRNTTSITPFSIMLKNGIIPNVFALFEWEGKPRYFFSEGYAKAALKELKGEIQ